MAERIWFLKQCRLFEQLTPEQLSRLEGRARVRTFPKGATIYMPADESSGVFVLVDGRVRLSNLTQDGKQAILAFIEPGELFGELALVQSGVREEYAEALLPSTIVLVATEDLERVISESPSLALGVTKFIGWRRQRIERRLRSLLFHSNRERLVHLLLELAEQYGKQTPEGLLIDLKLSHQDLASIIGSTRESVTVILGELQLAGYLRVSRQRIVICRPENLAATIGAIEVGSRPGGKQGRSRTDGSASIGSAGSKPQKLPEV